MDIKRVAFETKPINRQSAVSSKQKADAVTESQPVRTPPKREDIAAIVDSFLSKKMAEMPRPEPPKPQPHSVPSPQPEVKTILHEITPENAVQKPIPIATVDFVSEDDVRRAVESGQKIFISKKTILTPSARDLGEEKEVFARI
jgi:hypothetical protein